jgi:hypothetical protein
MKLEMTNFQAVAANLTVGGEVCDLPPLQPSTHTETDMEIAPRIQKITAMSIAEIDRLMDELQLAKEFLQSERERVEQETIRYANLAQMASVTTKIILDAVSQWHPARSQQQSTPSEMTSTEDQSDHHSQWDTSELSRRDDEPRALSGVGEIESPNAVLAAPADWPRLARSVCPQSHS